MTKVGVVIVHYQNSVDTKACIESFKKLKPKGFEYKIIVVDNGSPEPLNLPSKTGIPVEVLRSEANLGFTGGNNLGIKYVLDQIDAEYLLLLNNDTIIHPKFISELLKPFEQDPKLGITVPKIYFTKNHEFHQNSYNSRQKGKVLWYTGGAIDWAHLEGFHRGVDEYDRGQFNAQTQTDFATGCCMMLRRELLEVIGLFDENFFLYYEDVDLSLRTKQAGFKIKFVPEAYIWHTNAGSSGGSGSALHQYYQTRNRLLITKKHGPKRSKLTMLRLITKLATSKSKAERQAAFDFSIKRFGKKTVI